MLLVNYVTPCLLINPCISYMLATNSDFVKMKLLQRH